MDPRYANELSGQTRRDLTLENWLQLERGYTPLKLLGRGAYATVYKCINPEGNLVAVKTINIDIENQHAFLDAQRTARELYLLQMLNHPNIMRLENIIPPPKDYDLTKPQKLSYILKMKETDLSKILFNDSKWDQLDEIQIRSYTYQLLSALKYLRGARVLHRDLKPENILIDLSTGRLTVTDFNLSVMAEPVEEIRADVAKALKLKADAKEITSRPRANTGYIVTRYYRAPEILGGSTNYDSSADMWSFGVIVLKMLMKYVGMKPHILEGIDHYNQLRLSFELLGCKPKDLLCIESEPTRKYISNFNINPVGSLNNVLEKIKKNIEECNKYRRQHGLREIDLAVVTQGCELVKKVLIINPKKRLSIEDALDDPFVQGFSLFQNEYLKSPFRSQLKTTKGELTDAGFYAVQLWVLDKLTEKNKLDIKQLGEHYKRMIQQSQPKAAHPVAAPAGEVKVAAPAESGEERKAPAAVRSFAEIIDALKQSGGHQATAPAAVAMPSERIVTPTKPKSQPATKAAAPIVAKASVVSPKHHVIQIQSDPIAVSQPHQMMISGTPNLNPSRLPAPAPDLFELSQSYQRVRNQMMLSNTPSAPPPCQPPAVVRAPRPGRAHDAV